ncbi:MAG: oligosaccharide flippase family protein [Gemmatimonadales bacterium]
MSPTQDIHKDARDLARGALLSHLGTVAKVSKFLFVLVAARAYGPAALGYYFLAWNVVDIASKFGLWGVDRSLIRDIARYNVDESDHTKSTLFGILRFNLSIAVGLSLVTTAVLLYASRAIAQGIFHDLQMLAPLRLLAAALPFVVLTQALIATTKALRFVRYEVLVRQGIEPLVLLLVMVALIPFSWGAVGLVLAHVFASMIGTLAAATVALTKFRFVGWHPRSLAAAIKRDTLRFTSPLAAMDVLNLTVARVDIMLVGALLNAAAAGSYGIAIEIISLIKRIRQGFEPVFSPIVAELHYGEQESRLRRNYVIVTRWLLAGTLPTVIAIGLFPTQLLSLFNDEAKVAAGALMVLALGHGLLAVFSASETLLVMTGKSWLNTFLAASSLTLSAAVGILLIPKLGIVGGALGTLVGYAFVSGARVLQGHRLMGLHPFGYTLLWPVVVALLTTTIVYALNLAITVDSAAKLIVMLVITAVIYGGGFFGGAREPEERQLIARLRARLAGGPNERSETP